MLQEALEKNGYPGHDGIVQVQVGSETQKILLYGFFHRKESATLESRLVTNSLTEFAYTMEFSSTVREAQISS